MKSLLAIVVISIFSFSTSIQAEEKSTPVSAEKIHPEAMNHIQSLIVLIMEFEDSKGTIPKTKSELIEFKSKQSKFDMSNFQGLEFIESDKYRLVVEVETKPDTFVYKGTVNYNTKEDFTTDLKLYGK